MTTDLHKLADAISTASPNTRAFAEAVAETLQPTPPPVTPPAPTTSKFGIASGQGPYTLSDMKTDLDKWFASQKSINATIVRASYGVGEETSGQLGRIISTAAKYGVETQMCFPSVTDPATVKSAVAKYRPQGVRKFEGFNEANIRGIDPLTWRNQNNAMYDAAKQAAPDCVWVSAALCPYGAYGATGAGHWDPVLYLEKALAAGPLKRDRFGFHPYPPPSTDAAAMESLSSIYSGVAELATLSHSIVATLKNAGDPNPIIDATESDVSTAVGQSNETAQAAFLSWWIRWWKAQPWAGDLFVYTLWDHPGADKESMFGLIRNDWTWKPSAAAFKAAVAA